jgi:predicted N-acetyltransferase YhbS
MVIRKRVPADDSAIRPLTDMAFGGTDESYARAYSLPMNWLLSIHW